MLILRKTMIGSVTVLTCVALWACALTAAQTEGEKPKDSPSATTADQAEKKGTDSEDVTKIDKVDGVVDITTPKQLGKEKEEASPNYWIGVQIVPVPELLLSHFGMKDENGSLIAIERVLPEGPAEKGGVQRGDVVVKFGEKAIQSLPELIDQVNKSKGAATQLEVIRDGAPKTLTVTPIPRPEEIPNIPGVFNLRAMPRMQQQQFGRRPPNPLQGQDPQQLMRDMEEFFRRMQGGTDNEEMLLIPESQNAPNPPNVPGFDGANMESGKKFTVSTQTINGKTTIKVTQTTQKDGQIDEKKWEVENLDELPEEIRAEVQKITGK